jgi:quercetin dioxygenase-like cupin family protein
MFFILEGTYEMTVDGQTTTAGAGTIVFIPRNVVHRFKNVGDTSSLPRSAGHDFLMLGIAWV